jgi:twinkle protein
MTIRVDTPPPETENTWKTEIVTPVGLTDEVLHLYERGIVSGCSTGWPSLDRLYTVVPGRWTLVTGYPGSGKSEFVDALALNLAKAHGWRFCFYSPENHPQEFHCAKLLEKITGKPFFRGPTERMTSDEIREATLWLADHFAFIRQESGPRGIDDILAVCWGWIRHSRPDQPAGIIIDPWNEIEHQRPAAMSETEYISRTLTHLRQFARNNECHIWIIAHPRIVQRDRDGKRPIPTPSDVSGSAHWWNKADNAITIHRDQAEGVQDTDIYVQKVRFKHEGRQGMTTLKYDRVTGRYFEPLTAASYRRATGGG